MRMRMMRISKGGRNLIIMGGVATIIAGATTGVSLAIYHNSGDIYLDRSRPGYLPDEEEIEEEEGREDEEKYVFPKDQKVTAEVLNEYLEWLEKQAQAVDSYEKPFGEEVLTDEYLGIGVGEGE